MSSIATSASGGGNGVSRGVPRALGELGFRTWGGVALAGAIVVAFLFVFRAWVFRQYAVDVPALEGLPVLGGLFARDGFSASAFDDWGHAFIVPFISGYYVWRERARLRAVGGRAFWPGLLPVLVGLLIYWDFTIIGTHMMQAFGMLLSLSGLVMLTQGPRAFGVLFFPIAYLALATTVSEQVMNSVTWPLKLLASQGAYIGLNLIGIDAEARGNLLTVYDSSGAAYPLNVAEACSGMRMVVAFIALAGAVAFLSCKEWWQRTAVLLVATPVALLMNVVRVMVLGAATLWKPDLAAGASHSLIGTALLVPAFALFMAIVWGLNNIFVSEGERAGKKNKASKKPVGAGGGGS